MTREVERLDRLVVVVIGRNEGERLRRCLEAVARIPAWACYVDSGSRDGSAALARDYVASVLELDAVRPFCAARARNEGFAHARQLHQGAGFVLFLDGDCVVHDDWPLTAVEALDREPACAVVFGHLRERDADASPYARMCEMEWRGPAGVLVDPGALGGNMCVRASAFAAIGGFDERVIAGEDSELGVRLALAGHVLRKLDVPMATHEASIMQFGHWWRRAVRAGHAIGQRYGLHGRSAFRDCAREHRSVLFWGLALPLLIVLALVPTRGLSLLLLGAYAVLWARIRRYRIGRGDSSAEAGLYARYTVIAKFAEAIGLARYYARSLHGRYAIIEHK